MRKVVFFGLMLALGMALLPMAAARADSVSDEAAFVAKINGLRASKGLPALQVHENLVAKARSWSATMAAAGRIWHSTLSDGITANWNKLGENVGMGGSVDGLHDAFVASLHHYENLVDPAFSHVGIGIVVSGKTIFVTEVFMQAMPTKTQLSTPAPTATTAPRVTTTTAPRATTTTAPRVTTTTAPRVTTTTAPKPVAAAVPVAPATPPPPPVADPPAPVAAEAAPADPPRAPSALLVSVLERLRSFDS
jgi:hypothetical protein